MKTAVPISLLSYLDINKTKCKSNISNNARKQSKNLNNQPKNAKYDELLKIYNLKNEDVPKAKKVMVHSVKSSNSKSIQSIQIKQRLDLKQESKLFETKNPIRNSISTQFRNKKRSKFLKKTSQIVLDNKKLFKILTPNVTKNNSIVLCKMESNTKQNVSLGQNYSITNMPCKVYSVSAKNDSESNLITIFFNFQTSVEK